MKKILQINVTANSGSTGKIAEQIGVLAMENGWESWIAYGRGNPKSKSNLIRIGNDFDMNLHAVHTRIFDKHGLASKNVTKKFIKEIKEIDPDVIQLHNIHGYFINYEILFDFLKEWGGPVVWTLHDCWAFTGHCPHYTFVGCEKWEKGCYSCPQLNLYPKSIFWDGSRKNYEHKKKSFLGCSNMHIVTVSNWLEEEVGKSILNVYDIRTIYNGIDRNIFYPKCDNIYKKKNKIVLGVANVWDKRKGLEDFIGLRNILSNEYKIVLVGLSKKQISQLPEGIIGFERTESIAQLVELYSNASVYVNTSVEETLGMTTIEAMACGTPAIVYNSTANPEVIEPDECLVVEKKDLIGLKNAIMQICDRDIDQSKLVDWTSVNFDNLGNYAKYIYLYNSLIGNRVN